MIPLGFEPRATRIQSDCVTTAPSNRCETRIGLLAWGPRVVEQGTYDRWDTIYIMDTLGFEPRALRMRSGCDTTTPCAHLAAQISNGSALVPAACKHGVLMKLRSNTLSCGRHPGLHAASYQVSPTCFVAFGSFSVGRCFLSSVG